MLSQDHISPALRHSDQTFKKKLYQKNVNLDEKKSPHSEKSQKNISSGDKKSQTSVKKTQKGKFKSKKTYKLVQRRRKNVNLSDKK